MFWLSALYACFSKREVSKREEVVDNIVDNIVTKSLDRLVKVHAINSADTEVYKFGIEVTLLKIIHYTSYFLISLWMKRVFEGVIIISVYYGFRCNVGGYHAKTRIGCYIFSCLAVFISLLAVDYNISPLAMIIIALINLVVLISLPAVSNENRKVEPEEEELFRRRLYRVTFLFIAAFIVTSILQGWSLVWLYTIGLILASLLLVLGRIVLLINPK